MENSLHFYVKMCSLSVTAESLAGLGLILANDGIHPDTGKRLLSSQAVKIVKTLMFTCGNVRWFRRICRPGRIPSKSGVGGGILSVVDGEMGIGIFGPALDKRGTASLEECVLEYMSHELHLHMFDPQRHTL